MVMSVNESNIIEVPVSPRLVEIARQEAAKIPNPLPNSIREGEGTPVGFIGKLLVCQYLGTPLMKTTDFDTIHLSKRILVKTKACGSRPRPEYECSIAGFNTNQQCDYLAFTRVLGDYTRGWLLGYMPRLDYFRNATLRRAGEHDVDNNFSFHCDSYNLPISRLYPIENLLPPKPKPKGKDGDLTSFF